MAAAGHSARHLVDHLMNLHGASRPRMPKIDNLAGLGPMGVASSRCTTPSGHIRKIAVGSIRRRFAQNPPRGSGAVEAGNELDALEIAQFLGLPPLVKP